ncbi:hypothetical protein CLOSYM_02736 [[Clostridium] symbiosum ATCC 14940]|uniref:Uncharacterized protein n=1 Tax=[Clostridium] symbiosum ATCC 14940 TaxID=411472 RepID=A0ABC9TWN6_CLOSY|nr:hypothetical protein CLOSYM_02736 [[Clostridium] symbiosum ATCC 14940]
MLYLLYFENVIFCRRFFCISVVLLWMPSFVLLCTFFCTS